MFPIRPIGWAAGLDRMAEPAEIWHGMWAGSLPGLARMRGKHGGRTIYDSRDVYMESRDFARLEWPIRWRWRSAALERRWARAADQVITVNEPYADLLTRAAGGGAAAGGAQLPSDVDVTGSAAGPDPVLPPSDSRPRATSSCTRGS